MKILHVPEFKSYEEEAAFWDNLDSSEYMKDDGEWFHFETGDVFASDVRFMGDDILCGPHRWSGSISAA